MGPGFLGFPSTFMLDVVVCALVLVVPLLVTSICLVKFGRKYQLHKWMQVTLGALLLLTVGLFEIDMRLHGGWKAIVDQRSVPLTPERLNVVTNLLIVHLVFAVSTCLLWAVTIKLALSRFPSPPVPGPHSRTHKLLGWLSAIDITLTSLTGLAWYYLAFVA